MTFSESYNLSNITSRLYVVWETRPAPSMLECYSGPVTNYLGCLFSNRIVDSASVRGPVAMVTVAGLMSR